MLIVAAIGESISLVPLDTVACLMTLLWAAVEKQSNISNNNNILCYSVINIFFFIRITKNSIARSFFFSLSKIIKKSISIFLTY